MRCRSGATGLPEIDCPLSLSDTDMARTNFCAKSGRRLTFWEMLTRQARIFSSLKMDLILIFILQRQLRQSGHPFRTCTG